MSYKLIGEHFSVFVSLVFSSFSRNNVCKKTLSLLVAFFAVLLLREKQKKPFVSPTFLHTLLLENEEKTREKIQRNVFLSICSSHAKN